jgi:DNA (cytosine-5)-methyltransferase 1
MDPKAEALASAKKRIIELQSQMADRILKMAAEVAKLTKVVAEREAREFLRVTCNVPSSELSTYVKFAHKLAGSEDVLAKARSPLTMKSAPRSWNGWTSELGFPPTTFPPSGSASRKPASHHLK